MRVPPWVVCVLPGVFLSSRVTGACRVTTDLIMRVNVRTTTMLAHFRGHEIMVGGNAFILVYI